MQSMLQTSAAKANQALDAHRFDRLGLDVTRRLLERGKIHQGIGWQSDTHKLTPGGSLEFMKAVRTSRVLMCNFEVLM